MNAAHPLALAAAVWSGLFMLVIWVLAQAGLYVSVAVQMSQWHMFFSLSFPGLIGGIIEAAVISYAGVYAFVFIYNAIASKK